MRNLKRILALLTTLALLLTATAISEEQIAPAEPDQPAAQEQLVEEEPAAEEQAGEPTEEPTVEPTEEPTEEPAEEPTEEPTEEPSEEVAEPEEGEPEQEEPEENEPAEGEPTEEPAEEVSEETEIREVDASNKCPKNPDGDWHEWGYDKETHEPTGICEYCGAKCPHKDKYTDYWITNEHVEQFDQTRHILYYDQMATIICNDCEVEIETKTIETNLVTTDSHLFEDDRGHETDTCSECGYARQQCKHEHTSLWCEPLDDDVKYKKVDGVTHLVSGHLNIREYCDDCQKQLRDEDGYYTDVVEKHELDSEDKNSKCACGFKSSACKHQDSYIVSHDGSTAYIINCGNPTYHYRHYNNALRICNLCYNLKKLGAYNEKEEHVFKDGSSVCALCGYKVQASSISIDKPAKTTLNIGETLNLSATIAPANAVSERLWYSSNRAVATVSKSGVVAALAAGSANITVKAENGKASKALKITVVDPEIPTKLSFSSKKLDQKLDDTVQLKTMLTVEPATAKLMWESSNYEIVDVDEETGEAIMQSIGTATITVSAATVSGKKAKKASIKITVTDPSAPEKITLEPSGKIVMDTAEEPRTIKATLNPEAEGKWGVDWYSSNPDVVAVDEEGVVTAISKGTAKITAKATANNNKGKPVLASLTVQVKNDSFIPESMSVSSETLNLTTDDDAATEITAALTPEGEKYGSFTWSNNNKSVVFLDTDPDGKTAYLEPLAGGTAKITVTAKKNKKLKKIITVNVKDPHAPTSFKLKQTGVQTLFVGDDLQLEPVFGGVGEDSEVIYTPKKKGIVEVYENGLVTALKPGTVEITAKTVKKIGKSVGSAKVTIKVIDPKLPKEVKIDQKGSVEYISVGTPLQLTCTIVAEDGTQSQGGVKWTASDPKKALIDDEGNLYALKSGVSVTITATADAKGVDGKPKKDVIVLKTK